jgi:hypothetical protein
MTYALVDDQFDDHPSHEEFELEHFGLQICAITYCNRVLTDGFVSDARLRKFGKSGKGPKVAAEMVEMGKWRRVEGGYEIIGFLDRNPSKAQVIAKRAAAKARKDAHRDRQNDAPPVPSGTPPGTRSGTRDGRVPVHDPEHDPGAFPPTHGTCANLNPERVTDLPHVRAPAQARGPTPSPSPTPIQPEEIPPRPPLGGGAPRQGRRKAQAGEGSRIAPNWMPNPESVQKLREELRIEPLVCVGAFRDHFLASKEKTAVKADWDAAFRNWVRRDAKSGDLPRWSPTRPKTPPPPPPDPADPPANITPADVDALFASRRPKGSALLAEVLAADEARGGR